MVYVADGDNHTIRKITPGGVVSTLAGSPGVIGSADGTGSDARFFETDGVAVDSAGNVYVTDEENNIVRKITTAGVVRTLAGEVFGNGLAADGTGSDVRFQGPYG